MDGTRGITSFESNVKRQGKKLYETTALHLARDGYGKTFRPVTLFSLSPLPQPTISTHHLRAKLKMNNLAKSSNGPVLPPEILFKIAQFLHNNNWGDTFFNLSLASKETYCLVTSIHYTRETLTVNDDVVSDLIDFFSYYSPGLDFKDGLPDDIWAPKNITSSKPARKAWGCQFTRRIKVRQVDLLCLPDIAKNLVTHGVNLFPRVEHLAVSGVDHIWGGEFTDDTAKIVARTLVPSRIDNLCVCLEHWDLDGYLPFIKATLSFHPPGYVPANALTVDIRQNLWSLYIHSLGYDTSNESIVLKYLLRQWSDMKSCRSVMIPKLEIVATDGLEHEGRDWILHGLDEFNRKNGSDEGEGLISWDDLKPLIQFRNDIDERCCKTCDISLYTLPKYEGHSDLSDEDSLDYYQYLDGRDYVISDDEDYYYYD
ncbi:hypothetical protein M231_05712 [Tremella mesenterica]|uniref:Uncharacterized protein n=1 Tax=Tremella mesenterica TaxID=5217 RepID=A0A4Q1BHC6_TREME|nr:hypothetical protein M231_05712 [Tremella mesenterica]